MALADGAGTNRSWLLNVPDSTVKSHVTAILRKVGLYLRTHAAVLAQKLLTQQV